MSIAELGFEDITFMIFLNTLQTVLCTIQTVTLKNATLLNFQMQKFLNLLPNYQVCQNSKKGNNRESTLFQALSRLFLFRLFVLN